MSICKSITSFFRKKEVVVVEIKEEVPFHIVPFGRVRKLGKINPQQAFVLLTKDIVYVKMYDINNDKTICLRIDTQKESSTVVVMPTSKKVTPLQKSVTLFLKTLGEDSNSVES